MKSLIIGPAASIPFQLKYSSLPLVFQDQATVVIWGVYQIVQRFLGAIIFLPFFIYCLVEVPVFAAIFLQGKLK
jgi:hypothetical protein